MSFAIEVNDLPAQAMVLVKGGGLLDVVTLVKGELRCLATGTYVHLFVSSPSGVILMPYSSSRRN
jgi:hypothetical protein